MPHKDAQRAHPLLSVLTYIHKDLPNAEVVLITTVESSDGTLLSTTTEVMQSLLHADNALASPHAYAQKVLEKQKGMLKPLQLYAFTIVEYLPQTRQLRRQLHGEASIETIH